MGGAWPQPALDDGIIQRGKKYLVSSTLEKDFFFKVYLARKIRTKI